MADCYHCNHKHVIATCIGGGSIYKVGGPDAEDAKGMGEGLRAGVRNLYQLFIWK